MGQRNPCTTPWWVAPRSGSRQRRVTRLLVLIVVVFAVLWLPIHVHLLAAFFGHVPTDSALYMTLSVVWNCLAYANSCVNPIIYNYTPSTMSSR